MDKTYYIIANGDSYPKPVVEKITFYAKDNLSPEDIGDIISDIEAEHAQHFAYAVILKEKDFLALQALKPSKIKSIQNISY